jgi:hypothetical protein
MTTTFKSYDGAEFVDTAEAVVEFVTAVLRDFDVTLLKRITPKRLRRLPSGGAAAGRSWLRRGCWPSPVHASRVALRAVDRLIPKHAPSVPARTAGIRRLAHDQAQAARTALHALEQP